MWCLHKNPYAEAHAQLHLLDPRSSAWGSRPCCCSKPTSAWWRDRTASLCNPLEARLGRCVEISTTPRKQITVDPYEGRHETSGHHSCRECSLADVDGEGIQQCPMGASCLWHLCQVTSSSGPPTLLLHTHNWRMGKLRAGSAHWNDTEPRGHMGPLFKLCKTAEFPKTEFGKETKIRDDGEVTQVSLMRAHRE